MLLLLSIMAFTARHLTVLPRVKACFLFLLLSPFSPSLPLSLSPHSSLSPPFSLFLPISPLSFLPISPYLSFLLLSFLSLSPSLSPSIYLLSPCPVHCRCRRHRRRRRRMVLMLLEMAQLVVGTLLFHLKTGEQKDSTGWVKSHVPSGSLESTA